MDVTKYAHTGNGGQAFWIPTLKLCAWKTMRQGMVDARQVVSDLPGNMLKDQIVQHVYCSRGGPVEHMDIQNPGFDYLIGGHRARNGDSG